MYIERVVEGQKRFFFAFLVCATFICLFYTAEQKSQQSASDFAINTHTHTHICTLFSLHTLLFSISSGLII